MRFSQTHFLKYSQRSSRRRTDPRDRRRGVPGTGPEVSSKRGEKSVSRSQKTLDEPEVTGPKTTDNLVTCLAPLKVKLLPND